jgi:hypothetical protein
MVHYQSFDYYVEGFYTPARPERRYNEPIEQGEPASFEVTAIIQLDCNEDGEPTSADVTSELSDDPEFLNLCVCEYEEGGYDD